MRSIIFEQRYGIKRRSQNRSYAYGFATVAGVRGKDFGKAGVAKCWWNAAQDSANGCRHSGSRQMAGLEVGLVHALPLRHFGIIDFAAPVRNHSQA